jgi:hypothetical protein
MDHHYFHSRATSYCRGQVEILWFQTTDGIEVDKGYALKTRICKAIRKISLFVHTPWTTMHTQWTTIHTPWTLINTS